MNILIRFIASSVFFFAFIACEKYEDVVPYETYLIKEGKHSSVERLGQLDQSVLIYDVIFDESARYTINTTDQPDINKLFGFSECNSTHHDNSARFGWRWYQDSLQILAYCYQDGKVNTAFIGSVELNKSYRYSIRLLEDRYIFRIDQIGTEVILQRGNVCKKGMYYLLWPYFGGNNTAPHNITILMKRNE